MSNECLLQEIREAAKRISGTVGSERDGWIKKWGKLRDQIIIQNMDLIHSLVCMTVGNTQDHDDLVGEGCVGLTIAIEKFEFSRGVMFSTYAGKIIVHRILGARKKRLRMEPLDSVDENILSYDPSRDIALNDTIDLVKDVMKTNSAGLNQKEKIMVKKRFASSDRPVPLRQIGLEHNLTGGGVAYILSQAYNKLRERIGRDLW